MKTNLDILFVNPPEKTLDFEGMKRENLPPLGLAILAAQMEKMGYAADIVDCVIEEMSFDDFVAFVGKRKPRVVGITGASMNRFDSYEAMRMIKEAYPEITVLYGGVHATFVPEDSLKEHRCIDYVVRGEAEVSLTNLMDAILNDKPTDNILGISYMRGDKVVHNPDQPFVENLDDIPFPAWHLLKMDRYVTILNFIRERAGAIIASRGCPVKCTFCSTGKMWGKSNRYRSPENVMDEIEILINQYDAKAIFFEDDTLTLSPKFVYALCAEMKKRNMYFPWQCHIRANCITKELLQTMKDAGCYYISFGVESGSPKVLKQIKKGITLEHVERTIAWCEEIGIYVKCFFILGLEGETPADVQLTLKLLKELKKRVGSISLYTGAMILPGTTLESYARQHGLMDKDFNWAKPYYSPKNLEIGANPYLPILEQENMTISDLAKYKYDALLLERFNKRMLLTAFKRMRRWSGVRQNLFVLKNSMRSAIGRVKALAS